MAHEYDKSSKWLIQHHGDSILRLAGMKDIESWRALQAEVVQPRRLPDGILEVLLKGESDPDLFILEIGTYPETRLAEQLAGDLMMVYLNRRVVPEVVTILLHPKGNLAAAPGLELRSRRGLSGVSVFWHVVELWKLSAEDLLQTGDVGLVPWIPLTQAGGPPETLLQRCRETIDRYGPPDERANLLAVCQVFTKLRYNDRRLLDILGGKKAMIESPLIQELVAEAKHDTILAFLEARFGPPPPDLAAELRAVSDEQTLRTLAQHAATCEDLQAFRASLSAEESRS